jgi:hypothetical protein
VRLPYISINDDPRISRCVAFLNPRGAEWVEHDEVATEAPRSGLSRSDFVPWPVTSFSSFSAFPVLEKADVAADLAEPYRMTRCGSGVCAAAVEAI